MPGFLRRDWLALSIALLSSFATPAVALAHGHAHAELSAHEVPGHPHHDRQAEVTSSSHGNADHEHSTVAIGLKSFGPIVALPATAVASVSWRVLVPMIPCVSHTWHIPRSALPPPNLTRAPPATR